MAIKKPWLQNFSDKLSVSLRLMATGDFYVEPSACFLNSEVLGLLVIWKLPCLCCHQALMTAHLVIVQHRDLLRKSIPWL